MRGEVLLLELLDRTRARAIDRGASDVEISHAGRRLGFSRFAESRLTESGEVHESLTRVRAAVGSRVGTATTTGLDLASLDAAVADALEVAHRRSPSPGFEGFGRPDPSRAPVDARSSFHESTATFRAADRAGVLARTFARAAQDRLVCAGSFVSGPREMAVVTQQGVARYHRVTEALLSLVAFEGDASGHRISYSSDVETLDAEAVAVGACETAVRSRDPIDLEPATMDVVLMPPALAELLEWMALTSFSAREVIDGTSLLTDRGGTRLVAPEVTIVDDPGYPHASMIRWPFDAEGTIKQPVALFDRGVAGEPLTDLATAAERADPRGSTGHAPPLGSEPGSGPLLQNLVFAPGDATVDELVSRVERGILVNRFHYVNGLLDTRRATMTGMTREGAFLIEDGELGPAIRDLRFNQSMLESLSRIGGAGRQLQAVPTAWAFSGSILCPAILLRGFCFTGASPGSA